MKKAYINVKEYAEKYNLTLNQAHNEIQPVLFGLNYDWASKDYHRKVCFTEGECLELNIDRDWRITQCSRDAFIESDYDQEIIFDRIVDISYTCRNVIREPEYIEFNGKQYEKSKLEQALKLIDKFELEYTQEGIYNEQ